MIRHHEDRGAVGDGGGQRTEKPSDEAVDVLDRPVRLRRARPVQVLEAIDTQEMNQHEPGLVASRDVSGDAADHLVLVESLGQLGPFPLTMHRVTERSQLLPHGARGVSLEHALVLEERQVEIERRGMSRGRPVDGRRAHSGLMRAVVDGRGSQQSGRVVDGIAGEVLGASSASVQDVVGDDAMDAGAHARHQAHVRGPRRGRKHGLHAVGHHAKLGEPAECRQAAPRSRQ